MDVTRTVEVVVALGASVFVDTSVLEERRE